MVEYFRKWDGMFWQPVTIGLAVGYVAGRADDDGKLVPVGAALVAMWGFFLVTDFIRGWRERDRD
ncbi:MAG: hypothetical protein OXH97_00250 [Chloroflexota bacterium]|nr:hypothetical protein [Chloroflexota bacterium]